MSDSPSPAPAATPSRAHTRGLRLAIALALFGILLSIIHLAWPSPLMFTVFMLFGQSSFALAVAIYGIIILRDLKHRKAL